MRNRLSHLLPSVSRQPRHEEASDAAGQQTTPPSGVNPCFPRARTSGTPGTRPRIDLRQVLQRQPSPPSSLQQAGLMKNGRLSVEVASNGLTRGGPPTAPELRAIVETTGAPKLSDPEQGRGIDANGLAAARAIFAASLAQAAPRSRQPENLMNVAQAIRSAEPLAISLHADDPADPRLEVALGSSAMDITAQAMELRKGQHMYLPISRHTAGSAHQFGIGISKVSHRQFQVSVLDTLQDRPATGVIVDDAKMLPAMARLVSGEFAQAAPRDERVDFAYDDRLLMRWLSSIDPGQATSNEYFGRTLEQPPQNGGSCGTENMFAFMATVLPPDEYKLAKAVCLHATAELGDHLIKQDLRAAKKMPNHDARHVRYEARQSQPNVDRIREREASALEGHRRKLSELRQ